MKIYYLMLGIMIFSASVQIVDNMHIFSINMPYTNFTSAEASVYKLTDQTQLTFLDSALAGVQMLTTSIGYLVGMLTTAITIVPLAIQYQIPIAIYAPIQAIIWTIYAMGIFQLLTGRSTKLYD